MIRALLAALPLLATLGALAWALQTNPLAAPFVERTGTDLALALERQVRRTATAAWVQTALDEATAAGDADRAVMLLELAEDLGHPIDRASAEAMIAEETGALSMAVDCGICMADVANCPSLSHLTFCGVPFELTPFGDLNALRRAAYDLGRGADVDELDAGLAIVSLGATGAVIFSGGSSVTVKAGATLLRVARRIGSVTPALARYLRLPIRWSRVDDVIAGRAPLAALTDAAALARLQSLTADMGRVAAATSTAEALRLARFVDTPAEAARLARVAEAAGPRTTRTFAVLGKGRVFRASLRLSRAAAGTLVLMWLAAAQIAVVIGTRLGTLALRGLLRAV